MPQMTVLSFCSGNSSLHRLDVRCKLICICMVSIAVSQSGWPGLSAINLLLFYFLFSSRIKIFSIFRELRLFFILLLFIFGVRTLVTPGDAVLTVTLPEIPIPLVEAMQVTITREGLIEGSMVCWRFLTIMVLGILFTVTTRPTALKNAVTWLLKPFPMIPEKRAGMMVSLFIRFFPLILKKTGEVSDAQKARCGHLQRNPVKRTLRMGFPVLSRVFRSADVLTDAMTARCYSENRTDAPLQSSGNERYFYLGTVLLSGVGFFSF